MNDETPNHPLQRESPVRGHICPSKDRTTEGSAVSHHTETEQVTSSATARLVAALSDPDHLFTRAQLVFLMETAARWRAEQVHDEVAELNLDALYRAQHVRPFTEGELRRHAQRQRYRAEHDAAAVWPWRGDYQGGAVEVWEDPERGARAEAYAEWLKKQPRVWP